VSAYSSRPGTRLTENRTASELIKTKGPKGTLPDRAYEAERLVREEKKGHAEVAAIVGVSALTVERYCSQVRCERSGR
jgi:hypothetical protein